MPKALSAKGKGIYTEPFWDRQRFETASFCLQQTSLYFTAMAMKQPDVPVGYISGICAKAGFIVESGSMT